MGLLFLAFVLLPFAELFILIRIGRVVGPWPTLLGVIVVGLVGAYFAKQQGLRVMRAWQAALAEGRLPEEGILGGLLVLVGGLLLITPGILSDVIGLALLLPWTRRAILPVLKRAIERRIARGSLRVHTQGVGFGVGQAGPARPQVIDTVGEEVAPSRVGDGSDRDR